MGKNSNGRDIWWVIAIASSIVTLIGFLFGWNHLSDIFRPPAPVISATKTAYPIPTSSPQPTVKKTPIPSPTISLTFTPPSTPVSDEVLPITDYGSYEGIKMEMISPGFTGVKIKVVFPESGETVSKFLKETYISIAEAVLDIGGNWNRDTKSHRQEQFDESGEYTKPLQPGNYAVYFNDGHPLINRINGCNFPIARTFVRGTYSSLVFPVKAGYTTQVTYYPALLKIGVLRNGNQVVTDHHVYVNCQGKDLNGKAIIANPDNSSISSWGYTKTDLTGLATIFMAPGNYTILTYDSYGDRTNLWDIQLKQGEVKRVDLITK
jgi:hypothetical protein